MPKVRYGKLKFVEVAGRKNRKALWLMQCRCGGSKVVHADNVKSGRTTSCGCEQRRLARTRQTKHGMTKTPTYQSWYAMLQRCKRNTNYIGRVAVCKRWLDFANFYADMGVRPDGLTLERKNNAKGYSRDNCKWATRAEQNRNTRHNVMLTHKGVTLCAADWARKIGIDPKTFRARRARGWTLQQMLETPLGGQRDR